MDSTSGAEYVVDAPPFFSIDRDTFWPVVLLTLHRNPKDATEIDHLLACCESQLYVDDCGPYYLLVDPCNIGIMLPHYLWKVVRFLKDKESMTKKHIYEIGIFVPSATVKSIVELIKMSKQPAIPWVLMSTKEETQLWQEQVTTAYRAAATSSSIAGTEMR